MPWHRNPHKGSHHPIHNEPFTDLSPSPQDATGSSSRESQVSETSPGNVSRLTLLSLLSVLIAEPCVSDPFFMHSVFTHPGADYSLCFSPGVSLGRQFRQPPLHNSGESWQNPIPCLQAAPASATWPPTRGRRQRSSDGPVSSEAGCELAPWRGCGWL